MARRPRSTLAMGGHPSSEAWSNSASRICVANFCRQLPIGKGSAGVVKHEHAGASQRLCRDLVDEQMADDHPARRRERDDSFD